LLDDWEALEASPIHVMYGRGARPSARVRAFVEYVVELCADLEAWRRGAEQSRFAPAPMSTTSLPMKSCSFASFIVRFLPYGPVPLWPDGPRSGAGRLERASVA
jgi:hypothetical protein